MTTREIKLKIEDESELYSSLDPDQHILSDDIVDYLTRMFLEKHRHIQEKYVINIFSDTPVNKDRVKESIRNEFKQEEDDLRYSLRQLTLKEVCLAVAGVALLLLWLYLSAKSTPLKVEILSIMSWVPIWEATSIALMQRPELLLQIRNLDQLIQADINIHIADEQE